jgi:hypothetical protein
MVQVDELVMADRELIFLSLVHQLIMVLVEVEADLVNGQVLVVNGGVVVDPLVDLAQVLVVDQVMVVLVDKQMELLELQIEVVVEVLLDMEFTLIMELLQIPVVLVLWLLFTLQLEHNANMSSKKTYFCTYSQKRRNFNTFFI